MLGAYLFLGRRCVGGDEDNTRFVFLRFVGCKPGRTGHAKDAFIMFVVVPRDECWLLC
jgi:hypothetical protein